MVSAIARAYLACAAFSLARSSLRLPRSSRFHLLGQVLDSGAAFRRAETAGCLRRTCRSNCPGRRPRRRAFRDAGGLSVLEQQDTVSMSIPRSRSLGSQRRSTRLWAFGGRGPEQAAELLPLLGQPMRTCLMRWCCPTGVMCQSTRACPSGAWVAMTKPQTRVTPGRLRADAVDSGDRDGHEVVDDIHGT